MIRVIVVDDDPVCREGLRQILNLSDDVDVVGEADTADDALALSARLSPDVVILDADLPGAAYLQAMTRQTSASQGQQPLFICLAVYPDQHEAALQAGACLCLRKDGSRAELLSAVRAVSSARSAERTLGEYPPGLPPSLGADGPAPDPA